MPTSQPPQYSTIVASNSSSQHPPQDPRPSFHDASSLYTLATMPAASSTRPSSPASFRTNSTDRSPLLNSGASSYGATPSSPSHHYSPATSRRILFNAALKMAALFLLSTIVLGGTLWIALPVLEEQDRPLLHLPKSFAQLQDLNYLLKKYRDIYPVRIVICYVTTYLFLQAFSLPGSMYLSILGGAVWGVAIALPLACACVATGATLCYLISAAFGPALLTLPRWKARLESWSDRVAAQRANLLSYLIVLRIAPFPPHWVVNVVAPHLGIGMIPFWVSTFLGILGVTVIHTTIGGGLDEMTSPDDFHLISWKNFLGLSAVVVGVLIPVGLRFALNKRVGAIRLEDDLDEEAEHGYLNGEDPILAQGPATGLNKGKTTSPQLILLSDSEEEDDGLEGGSEEDEILEAGPAIVIKDEDTAKTLLQPQPQPQPAQNHNGWRSL